MDRAQPALDLALSMLSFSGSISADLLSVASFPEIIMKLIRHPIVFSGILLIVVLLAAGVWGSLNGFWRGTADDLESASDLPSESRAAGPTVELSPAKRENAQIRTALVERRAIRERRTIPGRFQYNQTKHIELRAPTDGTVQEIHVKPGDPVEPGTLVAVFLSSTIGTARAEVLSLKAQLELAQQKWEWERQVADHTAELVEILTDSPDVTEIEETFKNRTLGAARQTLLAAYARYHLADQMLSGSESLRSSGAMSAKTLQERTAEKRTAEAGFRSAIEQALFDSRQSANEAEARYQNAQRQLEIGGQKLNALLGYQDKIPTGDAPVLSYVELRSPIAGTVERIQFAPNERVSEKEALFVVADTRTLWVEAEMRDSDWDALKIAVGDEIEVQSPALPEKIVKARVIYVGREVSDQTHSLPLVAEIDNARGDFRPGLFARVKVPVGRTVDVIAVPPGSLMQHEGKTFVFAEQETGRFARMDVITGMETPEWVEIRRGLKGGENIVTQGAFILKSELLLEREE